MLRAILNKSRRQHPTMHQPYGHLPPITKTIQVRRTRHAGHCWRSRDELISDVLLEHTYSSYVRIRDVALKTSQRRWMIRRSVERGSGISVHDDEDDIYYINKCEFLISAEGLDSPNESPGYDTKQSDGEVPIMLELWGMQSISSLSSLPGPLTPGQVAPDRVLPMGQIELFDI